MIAVLVLAWLTIAAVVTAALAFLWFCYAALVGVTALGLAAWRVVRPAADRRSAWVNPAGPRLTP